MTELEKIDGQIARLQAERASITEPLEALCEQDPKRMSKQDVIASAWKLPELPQYLFDTLVLGMGGFMTGSKVYGDADSAADEDWVVTIPPHVFKGYAVGTGQDYFDQGEMTVLYAHKDGQLLNIICMSDHDQMKAWERTTTLMAEIQASQGRRIFFDKWKRVRVFRAFVDIFWPATEVYGRRDISISEALEWRVCIRCGREAINFTNKPMREQWERTGICERCEPSLQQVETKCTGHLGYVKIE